MPRKKSSTGLEGLPAAPLRKPQGMKGLPKPFGRRKPFQQQRDVSVKKQEFDLGSEFEDQVAWATKDRNLARRVSRLKQQYPNGTVPELIMVDYLESRQERYVYQAQLFGGQRIRGGIVPDFIVMRGIATAILVNGNYWHNTGYTNDEADKLRMLGQVFQGLPIEKVAIIWESRIMGLERKNAMEAAINGRELGP